MNTTITVGLLGMAAGAILALTAVWLIAGAPTRARREYLWWSRAGLADTARLTMSKLRLLAETDAGRPEDDVTQPLPAQTPGR